MSTPIDLTDPAVVDPFDEPAGPPRILVAATVFAVVVAMVMAVLLAVQPAGGTEAPAIDVRPVNDTDEPDDVEFAAAAAGVIETFEVFGAKNPFERPLPVIAPPPDTDPEIPIEDPVDGETPTTDTTLPPSEPSRGTRITLREVYSAEVGPVANVVVDGILYEAVEEGEVFAEVFQAVSLDVGTECGMFLYGDVDFELCAGQEILK